jgi:hypothetical protein
MTADRIPSQTSAGGAILRVTSLRRSPRADLHE